jgi:hypothetical protein
LFVIIKLEFPSNFLQNIAPSISRNDVVQAEEHHDQANEDLMEEEENKRKSSLCYIVASKIKGYE